MPTADEIWAWLRPPLDELKRDVVATPDQPWEARRESFLRELDLPDPSQHPVTEPLFRRLDEMPEQDRTRALGSNEIDTIVDEYVREHADAPAAEDPDPEGPEGPEGAAAMAPAYDEQAWQAYLAENGPQWDGTEATWGQFEQWFAYYAAERGLSVPAAGLLGYLTAQSAPDRITTLAQYGVTITVAGEPAAHQRAAEPVTAGEKPAAPAETGLTDADISAVMDELLAENPDFASIPADRRREITAEAASQLQSGAADVS
jgi:hypothetical protein